MIAATVDRAEQSRVASQSVDFKSAVPGNSSLLRCSFRLTVAGRRCFDSLLFVPSVFLGQLLVLLLAQRIRDIDVRVTFLEACCTILVSFGFFLLLLLFFLGCRLWLHGLWDRGCGVDSIALDRSSGFCVSRSESTRWTGNICGLFLVVRRAPANSQHKFQI